LAQSEISSESISVINPKEKYVLNNVSAYGDCQKLATPKSILATQITILKLKQKICGFAN